MASYMKFPVLASSGVAAVLSGALYFMQKEIIYPRNFPPGARTEVPSPAQYGHTDFEELHLPTPDGEHIGAFLIRPMNRSQVRNLTILMLHGNAGNIGHRVPIALKLQEELGCNILMLEYRGYGFSTGNPDEQGMMIDAQTALDYVRSRAELSKTKIVVYGQSIGGAVGIQLVAKNKEKGQISALVLENTFLSIRKLIPHAFPAAKYLSRLCHQVWPSETTLPKIRDVPILFLSGLEDEIVPPSHMRQLYSICESRDKIWKPLPGGTHNETIMRAGYFEYIVEFVEEYVLK